MWNNHLIQQPVINLSLNATACLAAHLHDCLSFCLRFGWLSSNLNTWRLKEYIHFILGTVILPEGYSTVHGRPGVPCPMESHMLPVCVSQYHSLVLLVYVLFLIRRNQRHVCGLPGSTSPGLTPYFRQCLLCYYCKLVFNFHISDNCCINRAFTNQNHPWPSSGRCHPTNFSTHELGIFNM